MATYNKPGVELIEPGHVKVRMASAVGRIDVIDGHMIFTTYQRQPSFGGGTENIVTDKISFPISAIPAEILFAAKVLALQGVTMCLHWDCEASAAVH